MWNSVGVSHLCCIFCVPFLRVRDPCVRWWPHSGLGRILSCPWAVGSEQICGCCGSPLVWPQGVTAASVAKH